ncbi:DUF58 domain-containing protein [Marinomonas ostreistagni]|uniref:DUF58 domain-containing protein n=1 Tax=Marinomonas ostreistagni TaxID=359209 RepID=UPI00194ED535|nr:DUF58 domain-containing protein [Marinomonas ostreistagni]MBM6551941.1 DUF58 domain-containing protein [Marinomonas ostreistagni]
MDHLTSPSSPQLSVEHIQQLAAYAKALGHAKAHTKAHILAGSLLSKKKGHGLDLHEIRPYTTHDEVRHMDWRITARTGTPHIKVYSEEIEHRSFIILQLSQDAYFGTQTTFISTRYAQLAALIAWRSHARKETVGAQLQFGQQQYSYPTIKDWQSFAMHLSQSTNIAERDTSSTNFSLSPLPSLRGQSVMILSDQIWFDKALEIHLAQLAQHNRVYWISLEDPNLFALPNGQYTFAHQTESGPSHINERSKQQAQQRYQQQQQAFNQQLHALGVQHLSFDVNDSPIAIARTLLARGVIH